MNKAWIQVLTATANTPTGLYAVSEPAGHDIPKHRMSGGAFMKHLELQYATTYRCLSHSR